MSGQQGSPTHFVPKATCHFFALFWLMACMALYVCASPALAQPNPWSAETSVTKTGILHVIHVDDFDPQSSHFLHLLEDPQTHTMHPLSFEVPPADHEQAYLQTGAVITVRGTARDSSIVLAAGGSSNISLVAPALAPGSLGPQKTLVLVANFSDTQVACSTTDINNTMFADPNGGSVDDLYQEASFGQASFSGVVQGPYTINYSSTSPCDYYSWATAAEAAAQAAGVVLSQYDRRVYVLPQQNSCGYIGLGTIGGNPSRAWIFTCDLDDVYAHELGHNLSVHHASTPTNEYGDISDVMGYGGIGLRNFNAPHKEELGWLSATQPVPQLVTVTQSGVYRIAPLELSPTQITAPQVLKIPKSDTQEFYYFSYRQPVGFDAQLVSYLQPYFDRVNVHRYRGSGSVQTYFLTALANSGSFVDAANGVTVTHVSHDANAATVQVSLGCSAAAPAISLAPATQNSKPGALVQYTMSVTNRDAAACSQSTMNLSASVPAGWTGTMSPNALTLAPGAQGTTVLSVTSAGSASGGNYNIQAKVLDSRVATHTATANATTALDSSPPSAPTNLTATVVNAQIRLAWKASTDNKGVSFYTVWRNGVQRVVTTGTSYTDTSTTVGMKYTYYVVASDQVGNTSAPSNTVSISNIAGMRR